ncbi:hypothetical protein JCM8547_003466 [Rhodosporidiobolus lusitaniae]
MRQTLSRLSGILPAYLSTSSRAPSASPTASSKTPHAMAHYTPSILDGAEVNATPEEWRKELDALPSLEETGGAIPSVFLAHGQPMLVYPPNLATSHSRLAAIADLQGPSGALANFLKDLGPALMDKYKPKAIVVFSAHWETEHGAVVTDYGDENPLLMDYYGFPDELYQLKFQSSGNRTLAERVVSLFREAGIPSRLTSKLEPRGEDGRGFQGPGLDHGVFVPFKLMFNDVAPVPIIQVSLHSSLLPSAEFALGSALAPLRKEGVLIIAGGLTVHTFREFDAFSPRTARPLYRQWERAIVEAAAVEEPEARKKALFSLVHHLAFRSAHPREEHFIPLYVAAGAAPERKARTVSGLWGAKTIVFGV